MPAGQCPSVLRNRKYDPNRSRCLEIQGPGSRRVPKAKTSGFDGLAYLSAYFDAIEINTSYYGPPRLRDGKEVASQR